MAIFLLFDLIRSAAYRGGFHRAVEIAAATANKSRPDAHGGFEYDYDIDAKTGTAVKAKKERD
jgi:hypothetical protein